MRVRKILACGAMLATSLLTNSVVVGQVMAADLLDTVRGSHVLSIGTSNDAPLSYIDSKTNEAAGVLPDILREVPEAGERRCQAGGGGDAVRKPDPRGAERAHRADGGCDVRPSGAGQDHGFLGRDLLQPGIVRRRQGQPEASAHARRSLRGGCRNVRGDGLCRHAEEGRRRVPGGQDAGRAPVSHDPERLRRSIHGADRTRPSWTPAFRPMLCSRTRR